MTEHQKKTIHKFLSKLYGDLICRSPVESHISWGDKGDTRAMVIQNSETLYLRKNDFDYFADMFSLPLEITKDNNLLLDLITPHLKLVDGSPAIPHLIEIGFITELTKIYCHPDYS